MDNAAEGFVLFTEPGGALVERLEVWWSALED